MNSLISKKFLSTIKINQKTFVVNNLIDLKKISIDHRDKSKNVRGQIYHFTKEKILTVCRNF